MKNIKRYTMLLFALVIMFSFAGCLQEKHTAEISSKGGTVLHEQVITKEAYNELISMGSDLEEIKQKGYVIDFYTKDNIEYVKASKIYKFDNLKALERHFAELATSNEGGNTEKYFDSFNIKNQSSNITITGVVGNPDAAATYTSCEIILKFDKKIIKHNIGKKVDNKTLKLDLIDLWKNKSGKNFVIKTGDENYALIFSIIGVVLLAVITTFAVILIIKKRNNNKRLMA